jgi:hypothetical protein
MINDVLKKDNKGVYEMINDNPQAKLKLKQIENYWKQIEQIIKKDFQKTLKGGR